MFLNSIQKCNPFCILILTTATLLNLLTNPNSFYRFFWIINTQSYHVQTVMLSIFLFDSHILYFLFFIMLPKTDSTTFHRTCNRGYPCLISDRKRKLSKISPSEYMFATVILKILFISLRKSPSIPSLLRVLITNGY